MAASFSTGRRTTAVVAASGITVVDTSTTAISTAATVSTATALATAISPALDHAAAGSHAEVAVGE